MAAGTVGGKGGPAFEVQDGVSEYRASPNCWCTEIERCGAASLEIPETASGRKLVRSTAWLLHSLV